MLFKHMDKNKVLSSLDITKNFYYAIGRPIVLHKWLRPKMKYEIDGRVTDRFTLKCVNTGDKVELVRLPYLYGNLFSIS